MKFKRLAIKNFKGIKSFDVTLGDRTVISGDNGTGKTSVLDALLWCTHGKNIESRLAHGPSGFSICPLNSDGSKIECDTEVSITIEHGDKTDIIKRVLSGSETKLYINDEPVLVKEYDIWINENISSQDIFRMYSNPLYFPSLPWQERRKIFTDLMPSPNVDDVLASMKVKIDAKIADKIRTMPVEKVIQSEHENLAKYEKEQIRISSKIDLLNSRNQEYVKEDNLYALVERRDSLKVKIDNYANDMDRVNRRARALNQAKLNVNSIYDKIKRREDVLKFTHENTITELDRKMLQAKTTANDLYRERNALDTNTVETICPVCGQDLPNEKIESAKASIVSRITEIDLKISEKRAEWEETKKKVIELGELPAFTNDEEYNNLLKEVLKAEETVEEIESEPVPEIADISAIRSEYETLSKTISSYDDYQRNVEDIKKYTTALNENARALEMSQRAEKDAGLYIVARAEYLVKQAQANFDTISVKLFNKLVNGKVKECFEITKDGVPYSDLNRAGKLQAGIEFIQFFERQNPTGIPIIADDFESYPSIDMTELVRPETQIITTIVKYGQKELICQTM